MSDPNEHLHNAFNRANVESRNGPQSAAVSVKWKCSDCGQRRSGRERNVCQRCGAEVCDRCQDTPLRQHPVESWR